MMPDSSTPPPPVMPPAGPPPSIPPLVIASQDSPHKKRLILAGLTIVTLIAGVITATILVLHQQRLATLAWTCGQYTFSVSPTGTVSLTLSSTYPNPTASAQTVVVLIDGQNAGSFSAPQIQRGQTVTLGTVTVPSGSFTWEVVGQEDCRNSGSYVLPSPTPAVSPSPTVPAGLTPTVTVSPSPSPSLTPSLTSSPTPSNSPSPSVTPLPSSTPTPSPSPNPSATPPIGGGPTSTPAPTGVPDPTATPIVPHPTAAPTPPTEIPASGTTDATWLVTLGGLLLIGFGTLFLAL